MSENLRFIRRFYVHSVTNRPVGRFTGYLTVMRMMEHSVYFVWKEPAAGQPFHVARREVKSRTSKGYPITFLLKCIPQRYASWEKAQRAADSLNQELFSGRLLDWPEEEMLNID